MSGSPWINEFSMLELDEIMRQREDGEFAKLLRRIRTATCTDEDIALLTSKEITYDDPRYPTEALHVYGRNADVDIQNTKMLDHLAPKEQQVTIKAIDQANTPLS